MCSRSHLYLRPGYVLWTLLTVLYPVYPCSILDFDEAISVDSGNANWTFDERNSVDPGNVYWTLNFAMTSEKMCCVPNCGSQNEILHKFPDPNKDPERFRTWLYNIGGDILALDNNIVFKRRRVCHLHFEATYHTRSKFLSANAIPRLCLPGFLFRRPPLADVTNQGSSTIPAEVPQTQEVTNQESSTISAEVTQTQEIPTSDVASQSAEQNQNLEEEKPFLNSKKYYTKKVVSNEQCLLNEIKKLRKKNDSYQKRLKKAQKLSTNTAFQTALKKFKTLAAIFSVMQFREITKPKMGRRFTKEEKVMALSMYKMGPKAYRWLSKIFILPSPITLSRMISKASLKPGINENIFEQLKRKVQKMKQDDRLCTLIFDEMALSPHFDYNQKKDRVSGFVNHTGESTKKIADHALVYMIRGITRNYKQPIYYSFCAGSTPKQMLAVQIKDIIKKLHSVGLIVLATVCDQGTSNTSAINSLIEETRGEYLRKDKTFKEGIFEVDGKQIIPLYDVPHLLKGIRNNLMTKNLKYSMDGEVKVAKWEHIQQLYENNPTYKGLKMIKNLTENHCNKDKIPKMKVKYASQLFSQTVGKTMGYLAENGILPEETRDTADFVIFIDQLFDSLNGSMKNSSVRSGKDLLRNVTPNSKHKEFWLQARVILRSMTFVTSKGSAGTVPSINNWVKTIENMGILRDKLFSEYNIRSFWCRHLNQDPLENFFGSIRSHGVRNNSPSCAGFESSFASLLINNMSSNYSPGSNCQEDFCSTFESFEELFFSQNAESGNTEHCEVDFSDMSEEIIVNFEIKKKDPRIIAQLQYVTGYVLRKANKIIRNCKTCKELLFTNDPSKNRYLQHREYFKSKNYLCYPSENLTKCFSEIQDTLHHILRNKSHKENLKQYMKTILYININTQFIHCRHQKDLVEFIFDFSSRFFAYNWCKWTNKLLNGTSTTKDVDLSDEIQNQAIDYYKKRRRNKKITKIRF